MEKFSLFTMILYGEVSGKLTINISAIIVNAKDK